MEVEIECMTPGRSYITCQQRGLDTHKEVFLLELETSPDAKRLSSSFVLLGSSSQLGQVFSEFTVAYMIKLSND